MSSARICGALYCQNIIIIEILRTCFLWLEDNGVSTGRGTRQRHNLLDQLLWSERRERCAVQSYNCCQQIHNCERAWLELTRLGVVIWSPENQGVRDHNNNKSINRNSRERLRPAEQHNNDDGRTGHHLTTRLVSSDNEDWQESWQAVWPAISSLTPSLLMTWSNYYTPITSEGAETGTIKK